MFISKLRDSNYRPGGVELGTYLSARDPAGREMKIEIETGPPDGVVAVGSPATVIGSVGDVVDAVAVVSESVCARFSSVSRDPGVDTIELEFGIRVDAEAGIVIAKARAECNFLVRIRLRDRTET